jgi:L-asparaginase
MNNLVELSGEPGSPELFYLRSCAKPLQASLIVDYGLGFSLEEIALCCASHAGEAQHIDLAERFLGRLGLDKSQLIIPIEHNCIGKHIMMLELCRVNGWDLDSYCEFEHPLQVEIRGKISELCGSPPDLPMIKDGCGVPTFAMTLQDMMRGCIRVFSEYEPIRRAFLEFPQIIGGTGKLDTKICRAGLVAKVGAGGLIIVVNGDRALAVKIADENRETREIVTLDALKQLGWANCEFL